MLLLYHLPVLITNFVTPYGKLQGAYYTTEGSSIVTSQKENELTILVDYGQLYENLDKLLKLNTTEYTKRLSKHYNRKFKQIKDEEFSNPINSDKHMIITRKQTAKKAIEYCHKVGGKVVNIDSDETLQTVIELGNLQRKISVTYDNVQTDIYNEFWQYIKERPPGQYVFANTDKSLPTTLNNASIIINLPSLDRKDCAYYAKNSNTFSKIQCTQPKHGICQSEINRNDIQVLESHLATYDEEIKELNTTKLLLQQQINQLEEDHISNNKPIIANIHSKFHEKLTNSIATFTENSLNSRGLNALINANKALLT